MSGWIIFGVLVVILVFLPPRYDPAIRLKYWLKKEKFPNDRPRRNPRRVGCR
jgi:hypothetical protein